MLAVLFFSQLSSPARVEAGVFYELNPDSYLASPLLAATSQNLYLLFKPQNDFLTGFDVWVDNVGPSGAVTFALRNDADSIVSTKTISVGTINPVQGGTKLHVNFPGAAAISNTKIYSLQIATDMPDARFYYVDNVKIIQHTSPVLSPYLTGVTKINDAEQDFVLKFALYEDSDTAAPQINNLTVTQQTSASALVSFNANEPVDYKIDYGLAGGGQNLGFAYQNVFTPCAVGIVKCYIPLTVEPEKTYSFSIGVRDSWNNEAFFTGQFLIHALTSSTSTTTPPEPLPPPPSPPPVSTKFSAGDRVKVTSPLNVRNAPSTAADILGTQSQGTLGTVTGGPTFANNFFWWYVNYDNIINGWSVEDNLQIFSEAPPVIPPPPPENLLPVTTTTTENSLGLSWTPNAGGTDSSYKVSIIGRNTGFKKNYVVKTGTGNIEFTGLPEDTYEVSIFQNSASGTKQISQKTVTIAKAAVQTDTGFSFMNSLLIWILPFGLLLLLGAGFYLYRRRAAK